MTGDIEIYRTIEREPLSTVRLQTIEGFNENPWRTLSKLTDKGALKRLVQGVYTAPPGGRDARQWKPTLETAALAIATARHGERNAILMGIGAARHWQAIPRAIGVTTVAIPEPGRRPVKLMTGGTIYFIHRDLDRLDATLESTELGPALVTTPAQTLFDLIMKPNQAGAHELAQEAIQNLAVRTTTEDFRDVIQQAARVNRAARQMLTDLERRDRSA